MDDNTADDKRAAGVDKTTAAIRHHQLVHPQYAAAKNQLPFRTSMNAVWAAFVTINWPVSTVT